MQCRQQHSSDTETTPLLPDWFVAWKRDRFVHLTVAAASLSQQAESASSSPPSVDPSIPPIKLFQNDPSYGTFDMETGLPLTMADGQPITKSAAKKLRKILDAHTKRHEKWKALHAPANASTTSTDVQDTEFTIASNRSAEHDASAQVLSPVAATGKTLSSGDDDAPTLTGTRTIDNEGSSANSFLISAMPVTWNDVLDPTFCRVVAGSFGKRQGLQVQSDMGPFCHTMQV